MFKLAERRASSAGVYCGTEGLFLGPSPPIALTNAGNRIRDENEIRSLLAAAYNSLDSEMLLPRLPLIREALQRGDFCRAMILAVQARLGPMAPEAIERLAQTDSLAKYNFNPSEPRDWHGRWTIWEGVAPAAAGDDHPAFPADRPGSGNHEKPTELAQDVPLDFSTHAWTRMQQRGITPDQVLDAINNGNRVIQSNGNIRCTGVGCIVVINPAGRVVTIY
ncbi:MAG: DUF4258 domain-containing protein [Stellaceae bacterium]